MCCALAALLGVLVHVSVTNQTVGQARDRALSRLVEATAAFEAGDALPAGRRASIRRGCRRRCGRWRRPGSAARWSATTTGVPTMWAAGPADGGRALAVAVDYSQSARTIEAPRPGDPVVVGAGDRRDAAGRRVRGDPGDPAAARDRPGGPADQRRRPGRARRTTPVRRTRAVRRTRWPPSPPRSTRWRPRCRANC